MISFSFHSHQSNFNTGNLYILFQNCNNFIDACVALIITLSKLIVDDDMACLLHTSFCRTITIEFVPMSWVWSDESLLNWMKVLYFDLPVALIVSTWEFKLIVDVLMVVVTILTLGTLKCINIIRRLRTK